MDIEAYDSSKVKKVEMSKVHPNSWNPKEKNHEKLETIEDSIRMHGFKQPIQVRTHPTIEGEYEIIDGEQRYTVMDNLGAEFIYIYDNGEVADDDAQNETLWWQIQVPFEPVKLANIVESLELKGMKLPYTQKELNKIKGAVMKDPAAEQDKNRLNIKLTPDQYEVVMQAINFIKEENDCEDARALELLCADYLAGI